ncbi:hypothetical protein Hdeb2414_s0036g00731011 [Helianthus debilis subsp. tardiflorus]
MYNIHASILLNIFNFPLFLALVISQTLTQTKTQSENWKEEIGDETRADHRFLRLFIPTERT